MNAINREMQRNKRRGKYAEEVLHSLFAIGAHELFTSLARSHCHFKSFVHLKEIKKKLKSFYLSDLKCRQKLRSMILDCQFFIFRGIYHHLIQTLAEI